jgi:hypothetical protein
MLEWIVGSVTNLCVCARACYTNTHTHLQYTGGSGADCGRVTKQWLGFRV